MDNLLLNKFFSEMHIQFVSAEPHRYIVNYDTYAKFFNEKYHDVELKYQSEMLYNVKIPESKLNSMAKMVDRLDRESMLQERYTSLKTAYNQYLTLLALIESQEEYEKYR